MMILSRIVELHWSGVEFLGQVQGTNIKPPADVELLKAQLEFLKADHARLAADFSERMKQLTTQSASVSDDFKTYLGYVTALLVFSGSLLAGLGLQSLEEAKKKIQTMINQQFSDAIASEISREVQTIRRSIARENVVSTVLIDYLLIGENTAPKEFDLLRYRGFQNLKFCTNIDDLRYKKVGIVVLDIENWLPNGVALGSFDPNDDIQQEKGAKPVRDVLDLLHKESILVVYVRGTLKILNTLKPGRAIPANSPITLLGHASDAAYVASAN